MNQVEFAELEDEAICAYAASGEPMGKAGGYGIQVCLVLLQWRLIWTYETLHLHQLLSFVVLTWFFLWKVSKANSKTCIMVLVLFYRELGALLWRELKVASSMLWDSLYTGTLPCHLQSGWEPLHVMQSFWPNRGELLSGALKRSLMQIIKQ